MNEIQQQQIERQRIAIKKVNLTDGQDHIGWLYSRWWHRCRNRPGSKARMGGHPPLALTAKHPWLFVDSLHNTALLAAQPSCPVPLEPLSLLCSPNIYIYMCLISSLQFICIAKCASFIISWYRGLHHYIPPPCNSLDSHTPLLLTHLITCIYIPKNFQCHPKAPTT